MGKFYLFTIFLLSLTACTTYKTVPYFSNIPSSGEVYTQGLDQDSPQYQGLKVKPDDLLVIAVTTLDNNLSVLGNTGTGTQSAKADQSQPTDGFLVNSKGEIELPLLGNLKVEGLTTSEIREIIRKKAEVYYKNPVVNVRIANFKITVLGEVNRPGTYYLVGEKASILDALGLAGDMTIFGKRENVMLIRQVNNKQKAIRFDLNSGQVLSSPYLYLQQNDVVYVEPNKNKSDITDQQKTRTISIIGATASVIAIILSRLLL